MNAWRVCVLLSAVLCLTTIFMKKQLRPLKTALDTDVKPNVYILTFLSYNNIASNP